MNTEYDTGGYDVGVAANVVVDFKPRTILATQVAPGLYSLDGMVLRAAADRSAKTGTFENPDMHYLVGDGRSKPAPFPMEVLDKNTRNWCAEHAKSKNAPVDHAAMAVLGVAAGCTGNRRWGQAWPGFKQPSILWLLSIASSGGKKSPAQDPVVALVQMLEREACELVMPDYQIYLRERKKAEIRRRVYEKEFEKCVQSGEKEPEFPDNATAPDPVVLPQTIIQNITPESFGELMMYNPKGLMLYNTELAEWWGGMDRYNKGAERKMWLQTYDAGSYRINRKNLTEPYNVDLMASTIIGGTQPGTAAKLLDGEDDGLIHRMLISWCNEPEGVTFNTNGVDITPLLKALRRIFMLPMATDLCGCLHPQIVPFASTAIKPFQDFMVRNDLQRREADETIKSMYAKGDGQVIRLAMLLSLLDWAWYEEMKEPERIERTFVDRAIKALETYFQPHALRMHMEAKIPPEDSAAGKLIKHIKRENLRTFNAKLVRRVVFGGRKDDTVIMDNARQHLVHAGLIRVSEVKLYKKEQRPVAYEANPLIWATKDAAKEFAA